jgi:hypothetical protein
MKNLVFLILLLSSLSSCNNLELLEETLPPPSCDVSDPVNSLPWLKKKTDKILQEQSDCPTGSCCLTEVDRAIYEGKTVFVFGVNGMGNMACCGDYLVYSCQGDFLGTLGTSKVPEVENRKVIWKSR